MSRKIVWTAFSQFQLNLVYEFTFEQSPTYADKVMDGIDQAGQQLLNFPLSGTVEPRLAGLAEEYRFVLYSYFKVVYRVENSGTILIVNIFDTRQHPEKLIVGKKL